MIYLDIQLRMRPDCNGSSYRTQLEQFARQICKSHSELELGIPWSAFQTDGTAIDSVSLVAQNDDIVNLAADELIFKLSSWPECDDVSIVLIKRRGSGSSKESIRKVFPTVAPVWDEVSHTRHTDDGNIEEWPDRLRYIARVATRYYGVGGNDVTSVFRAPEHFRDFVDSLGQEELSELLKIAATISIKNDHIYIMNWFDDTLDGNIDWPRIKALYFLAILERLREEGVFGADPNLNDSQFIDWNKMGG